MPDSTVRTPLSPSQPSTLSGATSISEPPRPTISHTSGRQRSRTFSEVEAEEKRERVEEKERANAGVDLISRDGTRMDDTPDGKISANELRAEVSYSAPTAQLSSCIRSARDSFSLETSCIDSCFRLDGNVTVTEEAIIITA